MDYANQFSKKIKSKFLFPVHPRTKDLVEEFKEKK